MNREGGREGGRRWRQIDKERVMEGERKEGRERRGSKRGRKEIEG